MNNGQASKDKGVINNTNPAKLEDKWHALYTSPRAEKKVEQRLKENGLEVFLPTYITKRKWSDRVKNIEVPLFNSYIFIKCNEYNLTNIRMVYGVVGVVMYDKKPAVIKEYEIDAIKDFIKLTDKNKVISEGDIVEIMGGSFDHQSGKVIKLTNKYYYLHLDSLTATVCVEVTQVEKINK